MTDPGILQAAKEIKRWVIIFMFTMLVVLIGAGAAMLELMEIVRPTEPTAVDVLRNEVLHLTHPKTIQERTLDYILQRGEFGGAK